MVFRPINVILHELGHALFGIIFSNSQATIYIGSYGDKTKSFNFRLGKLEVWFKYDNFLWENGLCELNGKVEGFWKKLLYILGGPLMSLFMFFVCVTVVLISNFDDTLKIVILVFAVTSLLDFFQNINPNPKPIKLFNGSETFNDGYQAKNLFELRHIDSDYLKSIDHYNNKEFSQAIVLFEKIVKTVPTFQESKRLLISSYLQLEEIEKAYDLNSEYEKSFTLDLFDYCNSAYIKLSMDLYDESLIDIEKALEIDPESYFSLNNKGHIQIMKGEYFEAVKTLNNCVNLHPNEASGHNNLGYAFLMIDKLEEGVKSINNSLAIDPNNAHAICNQGIYHFKRNDLTTALNYFETAKVKDDKISGIDEWINKCKTEQL